MDIEKYRYLVYTDNPDQIYTPSESAVTGVKGNEEQDYRTGNVNITCADIGALPSDDAVTGVKGNEEQDYRTGNVNITCADIGAAEDTHVHSASDITSGILSTANGGTGSNAYLSDGVMNKINTIVDISVANSAWKNGGSFTLNAGVYLAIVHTEWASNNTGTRLHCLSSVDPDTAGFVTPENQASTGFQNAPSAVRMTTCDFLTPTATTTYYLGLFQNSGAALNCISRRVRVIRLQ